MQRPYTSPDDHEISALIVGWLKTGPRSANRLLSDLAAVFPNNHAPTLSRALRRNLSSLRRRGRVVLMWPHQGSNALFYEPNAAIEIIRASAQKEVA
jgi:hypothetical protein